MHFFIAGDSGEFHHLHYWNHLGNMMKEEFIYESRMLLLLLIKLMLEYVLYVCGQVDV